MGRKSFLDGKGMTVEQAEALACPWTGLPEVQERLSKGQKLLVGGPDPDKPVHSGIVNIGLNAAILRPLALLKRDTYKRLSAFKVDVYATLMLSFYEANAEAYEGRRANFNPKSWAWEQAWTMHKMFSKLRTKVMKDEMPTAS